MAILAIVNKVELSAYLERLDGALKSQAAVVELLPPPFNRDTVVRENLNNLKADMAIWKDDRP